MSPDITSSAPDNEENAPVSLGNMPQELLDMIFQPLNLRDLTNLSATSTEMRGASRAELTNRRRQLFTRWKHCDPHDQYNCRCQLPHRWWNIEFLLILARGDVDPSMIKSLVYVTKPSSDVESACPTGGRGTIFRERPSISLEEREQITKLISRIPWIEHQLREQYVQRACDADDSIILQILLYLLTELRCLTVCDIYQDPTVQDDVGDVLSALQVVRHTVERKRCARSAHCKRTKPLHKLTLLNCQYMTFKTVLENLDGLQLKYLIIDSCYDTTEAFQGCPFVEVHIPEIIIEAHEPDIYGNYLYISRSELQDLATHFQAPVTFRKRCSRGLFEVMIVDAAEEDDWTYCHCAMADGAGSSFDFGHSCARLACNSDVDACVDASDAGQCYRRTHMMLEYPEVFVDAVMQEESDHSIACGFCEVESRHTAIE